MNENESSLPTVLSQTTHGWRKQTDELVGHSPSFLYSRDVAAVADVHPAQATVTPRTEQRTTRTPRVSPSTYRTGSNVSSAGGGGGSLARGPSGTSMEPPAPLPSGPGGTGELGSEGTGAGLSGRCHGYLILW